MNKLLGFIRNIDWLIMAPALFLLLLGLSELYGVNSGADKLFEKQLLVAIVGLLVMAAVMFVDYYWWYSYSAYLYVGIGVLLLLVLFVGVTVNSTTGWFNVGAIRIQPVEFAKLAVIVGLARYLANVNFSAKPWRAAVFSGILTLIPAALVLFQPDTGSAAILICLWIIMLSGGLPKKKLLSMLLLALLTLALSWQFMAGYQRDRVLSVFSGRSNNLVSDYNVNQAIIAVGSGNLWGRGLGFGSQSQLRFLPEAKTDFIFSVVAEELGFWGALLVIGSFGLILWRLLRNLSNIKDNFGIFFLLGFAGLIFIQMFINIGMNLGLLPVVGITLPFLSYGGSSLLASLIMLGIAQSVIIRAKIKNY